MGAWEPLSPGTVVGQYRVEALIATSEQRQDYLARLAPEENAPADRAEPYLRLIETPAGAMEPMRAIEALQLRQANLLALREWFAVDDREYLVADLPDGAWPPSPIERLIPEEALAVGVIIGLALAFLHTRGVAHLRVRPETILLSGQSVVLSEIENATLITEGGQDADALFARDANLLAQTVGGIARPGETDAMSRAIERIAQRGAEAEYTSVREVQADLLHALPDGLPALAEAAATAPMSLQVGHATTVGLVRTQNQDAIGILALEVLDDQPLATPGGIFLVADGMGGEAQGEVASRIAARMIVAEVARRFLSSAARATASDTTDTEAAALGDAPTTMNLDSITALVESFRAANARIRNMVRRLERASGTTTTALMLFGHEAVIGHIGDSRAYLTRGAEIVQLTNDHSLLQKLIELGQINATDPNPNVPRNYLYRSLGQADEIDVDTRILRVGVGDSFMICSDGLWDLVPDEQIREVLTSGVPATDAARDLVRRANAAGGFDNSTVVVIRLLPRQAAE